MGVGTEEVNERALVRSLKVLRELVEAEHRLEIDRAAALPPLVFEIATPATGSPVRSYVFRAASQPGPPGRAGTALRIGDGVEVVFPDGRDSGVFGMVAAINPAGVAIDFARPVQPADIPAQGALRLRADDNQHRIRLQAIERVVRERHALGWIGAVLTEADVASPAAALDAVWEPPAELGVTAGQRRALVGASRGQHVFLIQGPPGTGKTTVITALLRYFARERGARVLLSSKGHRAIDNALDRLGAGDLHVLRLGQAAKVTGAGREVLVADVLAQAEDEVPRRYLAARTDLENVLRSLHAAAQLLAELADLNGRIDASDSAIAQRVAEIEDECARGLEAIGQQDFVRRFLHRGAEPRLAERRRLQLERDDLTHLREHVAQLCRERGELVLRSQSILPGAPVTVSGVAVPALSIATPDVARTSLTEAQRAHGQASAALHRLRAWGTLLDQPGALADVLVEAADVVAATAVGVNSGRDGARTADMTFDVAIIDEAGQAHLTDLVVPFSRARSIILVGDHQQLPPYLDDELLRRCTENGIDTAWLEKSVFESLWDHLPDSHRARLDLQFRMPEVIADFLGRFFYDGELATAPARQGGGPVCDLFASPVVLVDTSTAPDRAETAVSPGFLNRCEARLVADIVARLPAPFRTGEGLGVIAPYSAQVAAARESVAEVLSLAGRDPWLADNIATVDSFQGQERDVILVSLTRSNADGAVGFLSDLKRLNVTLSRARQQLVILGDLSTHCAPGGGPERRAFARCMRELADHLRQHGQLMEVDELRRRLDLG